MALAILPSPTYTSSDAERDVQTIHDNLAEAKQCAWRLWNEGWKLLTDATGNSYASFHACIQDRFDRSASQVYRLKDARVIELEIEEVSQESVTLRETHTRHLRKLESPESKFKALELAREIASSEGTDPTARHIEKAVTQVQERDRVETSPHHVIKHMLAEGKLSVEISSQIVDRLNKIPPQHQYAIQAMIARAGGFADPDLIPELSEMLRREGTASESMVLGWIKSTGDVFDVSLAKATMRDLKRARYEASRIRKEDAMQKIQAENPDVPVVEEVIITIYKGDVTKTAKILERILGLEEYQKLCHYMVDKFSYFNANPT